MYTKNTTELKYNRFLHILKYYIEIYCPKKHKIIREKKKQPFNVSPALQQTRAETIQARDVHLITGNRKDKSNYLNLKRTYDSMVKLAKREQVNQRMEGTQNKTKETLKIINEERRKTQYEDKNIQIKTNGKLEKDPKKVAKIFNEYFIQIGQTNSTPGNPCIHEISQN